MKIIEVPDNCPFCGSKLIFRDDSSWNGCPHFSCELEYDGWMCFSGRQNSFIVVNWKIDEDVRGICLDFKEKETVLINHNQSGNHVPHIIMPFVDDTLDFSDITIDYMNRLLKLKTFL